jgi:hypothetical protein
MTRLLIHVESETEEAFVNEVRGKIGTRLPKTAIWNTRRTGHWPR